MSAIDLNSTDWALQCSDEELSNCSKMEGNIWVPESEELDNLYNEIDKHNILSLEWKCPGRRPPSPVAATKENQLESSNQNSNLEEKSDFDFMDEVTSLRLRVRREGEDTLRGSAKKKTTSFDGIVSNIMRHKRLEQMERDATSTSSANPN